jgi:DNA-binding NarL/FixJ family response regulator
MLFPLPACLNQYMAFFRAPDSGQVQPLFNVLIADGNTHIRALIREVLAAQAGIRITGEAANSRDCFRHIRHEPPDLVLLDLHLPGVDGLAVLRRIKQEMSGVRVIVLGLFDLLEYREAVAMLGGDGYVVKEHLVSDLMPAIKIIRSANRHT